MATKKRYYMVSDDGIGWYLSDEPDSEEHHRPAVAKDLTASAVADYLDQRAEDCNAHHFVGCHRALTALLRKTVGSAAADKVMRKLLEFTGLHGLVGLCEASDARAAAKYLGFKP